MKKSILLPLLLLASGLFAQQNLPNTSEKALPSSDPSHAQRGVKGCIIRQGNIGIDDQPNAEKNLPPIDPTILQGMPADTEAPVVTCLNGLSVNIMPTGMIQLWASDFLLSVSDNVTPVDQIKIGIRKAGTGTGFPVDGAGNPIAIVTFDCNELGTKDIELWAMDDFGNAAFCITTIILQDNLGNCPGNNSININLCARVLCSGVAIETAIFELDGSVNFAPPFSYFDLSDASGCSDFTNNVPVASTFTIKPIKDDNPLNGMDEQDFVLLSKHINGTQPFTEPWQWVAADANRDGLITLADSIEFRNLALGIYTELPDNHSWRFVPEGYQFPVPDPLAQPLPESVTIAEALTNMDTIFVGIKIGDLDCSAIPNFSGNPGGGYNQPTADKNQVPIDPTILQGLPADTEAPEVTCLNGLIVNIMPTGTIQLWASDFLQSVSDNVTPVDQIKIGIRKAGTGTGFPVDGNGSPIMNVTYNCAGLGMLSIELWAIDEAGNAEYCETEAIISDDFGYCSLGYDSIIVCINSGCNGEPMPGVEMNVYAPPTFFPPVPMSDSVTGPDGCAKAFFPYSNNSYIIAPEKDGDLLNGVTTYDLLLISKHIQGIDPLDNPYKMIAADVNKSGSITTFDILELKKLMMGIYSELPNNTSWRFVDADFMFQNPNNPFQSAFPETINMNDTLTSPNQFFGIKIGDVDCTADLNGFTSPPDFPDAQLAMPDTLLLAGQVYDIPLYMAENGTWSGYQFALNWDAQKLEFQSMSLNNETSPANWNTLQTQQGILISSWFQYDVPIAFGANAPIAIIRFKALQTVVLKEEVSLSNDLLHPEGYAGFAAEKRDLLLTFEQQFKPSMSDPIAEKNLPPIDPTILQGLPADTQAPVVTCLNGLSVNIMPTGMIGLWASDFLLSVSDNETPTDQIKLAVRQAGVGIGFPIDAFGNTNIAVGYNCDNLGSNEVELWAKDLAGNVTFCITSVVVQDIVDNCHGQPIGDWLLEVCANTETSDGLEEMVFDVTGTNPNVPFYANDVSGFLIGCGYFDVPIGSDITAKPIKDDNPLNGVTTYDRVLISRHYRGIELLNSPYKIIAADINRDGMVTEEDSVELTKLILGIYTELPNNTSWRFVDKNYVFPDPSNPFAEAFPEAITVQNIQSQVSVDFAGIKVGDVNNTAVNNLSSPEPEERAVMFESFSIGQPQPNPTQGGAMMPIYLPTAENLQLEISDLTGRVLWVNDLHLEKGSQILEIPASAMSNAGVFVWRVRAGEVVKAGKLVRL